MDLAGKTVLITGGSRGMGRSLALRLGSEQANVVVNYRKESAAAEEVARLVTETGGKGIAVQADVSQPDDVVSLAGTAADTFGKIDVVVANAAASAFKPLSEIRAHHIEKTMAITVNGFLGLVQAATPHMVDGGRIIAMSGWDSFRMLPGHGLLGAAKAALETMVRYLAIELGPQGITAVGVCPGPIDTDSFRTYAADQWEWYEKNWLAMTPSGKFPTPDEVAEVTAFFCSPHSVAVNGQTIVVDGGLSVATMPRHS